MRKTSRRPARELQKARRKEQKKLRQEQRAAGLVPHTKPSIPNTKSTFTTPQEEEQARQEVTLHQTAVMRGQLPGLLKKLSKIHDPRNPKKIKHKLTTLMVYGILTFVFQMTSRREANRTMTRPVFMENLQRLFPDLESVPHHDTLYRLLDDIEVEKIEQAHLDLVNRLIRGKKFKKYLVENRHPIAIDGTQKFARDVPWCDEALERSVGNGDAKQYYCYVVEATMAFRNGMVLPLMSEHLSLAEDEEDCETKAFKRLAARLKAKFSHLPILLLLDGLYANGPIMKICRKYNWRFMIVLKDNSLPRVWAEAHGLARLQKKNRLGQSWGDRHQRFWWANDILYTYGPNDRHRLTLHVVVCEERWQTVGPSGERQQRESRHAWISSHRLEASIIHERCNLGARHRWGIEANILVEKHQGYRYQHSFAYSWNALRGYHYLMRLGHFFNVLASFSKPLRDRVRTWGVRGLIAFVRETITGPWLSSEGLRVPEWPPQLRLV